MTHEEVIAEDVVENTDEGVVGETSDDVVKNTDEGVVEEAPEDVVENQDEETTEDKVEEVTEKIYDLFKINDQVEMFKDRLEEDDIKSKISEHINKILSSYNLEKYHVVFLFDEHTSISGFHSDKIYREVTKLDSSKDILMFIESGGGQIEPAYLISKTCKRLAKNKFMVSIPRRAKSAATLISLGATELHMGLLSEL